MAKSFAAKKAAHAAAKAERQRESAARAAGIWQDREGKARPTPERKQKGAFVLRDGEDAGLTIAVDEQTTELDRLAARHIISQYQRQGGHDFAAMMDQTRLIPSGRSCIDFSPVGHDDAADPTPAELRALADRAALHAKCPPAVWRELRHVCCDNAPPRSVIHLRHGLTICAEFWA